MSNTGVIVLDIAEVSCKPDPGSEISELRSEVLLHATSGAGTARFTPETAIAPLPPDRAAALLAESLAAPWPPIDAPVFLVEVLLRDTVSSAIVATGMNAFGDAPWSQAQRGVFAFRHDWTEPLVERLEWQTSVTRLASGNESRLGCRSVPRRWLTYQAGNARQTDALVADWLADHLGQMALWPLPQYALHLTEPCERGALALSVVQAKVRQFGPISANLCLTCDGIQGWQDRVASNEGNGRWALIIASDGWQMAQLDDVQNDRLSLSEPLARAAAMGSTVMPLVWGKSFDRTELTQWVPGMAGTAIAAQIQPAPLPDDDLLDDPWLDQIPVWPDGNWQDNPTAVAEATTSRLDFPPADPWLRRDDPWPANTFQRRYLASTYDEIETWRARLWRAQGRLEAFWLPDGLAPVLRLIAPADPGDGFLRTSHPDVCAFWHRPAACLILHPDGTRQHALTATSHQDHGLVLVLRSGLADTVPAGSRVIRLTRCRLDHDAIDLYWHSPTLMEIPLTARQLPEPRGNDRITYLPA